VLDSISKLTGCRVDEIRPTHRLVEDLGVDSIIAVNMFSLIEEELNSELPEGCEGSLVGLATVGELIDIVTALMAERVDRS
jgi:acyl carrier protein